MDHALGDALVVEMGDLLAKDEILQQHRAARADSQRVLVVRNRDTLVGRHDRVIATRHLMQFATGPGLGAAIDFG